MSNQPNRRDWMKLIGVGGLVYASSLSACSASLSSGPAVAAPGDGKRRHRREDFLFLQLSDTHWGFSGPPNPEAEVTLKRTVETINSVELEPDFIVFTGDLTHKTDDPAERRRRMAEFKEIVHGLKIKNLKFLPGEHDASADRGEAYREHFGDLHYSFDHKGVHFVALDNVSDPAAAVGSEQMAWLETDLKKVDAETEVVVFAHRPLFDLYPEWDWATKDGKEVVAILSRREKVTVFYGHIHQENHHVTGKIAHHSAKSLIFALPAPGSAPKRAPIPWDPGKPGKGLGYRSVGPDKTEYGYRIDERSMERKG
jgi:3',5'-cyclic AMP phosphodiesterase CpdA